jgi:hypothetical protein
LSDDQFAASSACFLLSCLLSASLRQNDRPQASQTNWLSPSRQPSTVSPCRLASQGRLKVSSQRPFGQPKRAVSSEDFSDSGFFTAFVVWPRVRIWLFGLVLERVDFDKHKEREQFFFQYCTSYSLTLSCFSSTVRCLGDFLLLTVLYG